MPQLLFHGAAGEVTGSMHMLQVQGRWIALDCGMFQGQRRDSEEKNRQWPMSPRDIAAVVLSHAHIDHSGRLPRLVRDGFSGRIFCTPATRDLAAVMLADSAKIQEEDARFLNKRLAREKQPPVEPLYATRDAVSAVRQIHAVPYDSQFEVIPGITATLQDAGHMLGSASIVLNLGNGNARKTLFYTADVGRRGTPILRDPEPFKPADLFICESTYGGRVNQQVADAEKELGAVVQRTAARGGKLIVPAFSVGRTQTIVYYLRRMMRAATIANIPIFIDSPLSVNATEVYKMHPECYDADAAQLAEDSGDLLGCAGCTYISSVEESKRLNSRKGPLVIISASGMCENGRIRHHIRNNISDPANTLLLPGYQAQGTLGRRLADGAKRIRLFNQELDVRFEVVQIHGFSGHADQADLLRMLEPLKGQIQRIMLVHGEAPESAALAEKLQQAGFANPAAAQRGQRVEF